MMNFLYLPSANAKLSPQRLAPIYHADKIRFIPALLVAKTTGLLFKRFIDEEGAKQGVNADMF